MSNQANYQNIQRLVIEPMTRIYYAPSHLRDDKKAFEEALGEYHRALNSYPAAALERGWLEVKDNHKTWSWPHFQTIRDACEKFKPAPRDVPEGVGTKNPWDLRNEKREKLVEEYSAQFEKASLLYFQAVREGWELHLWRYIRHVASIQAMMIVGDLHIGWNGQILFKGDVDETAVKVFLQEQKRQAQTGVIDVSVPTGWITEWQAIAVWRKNRDAQVREKNNSIASPAPAVPKTPLDQEIACQIAEKSA